MNVTKCRSCGASIVWIKTISGKFMPCDAKPQSFKYGNSDGTAKLVRTDGVVVSCEIVKNPEEADGYGFMPHWSTCDAPDKFRKERRKAKCSV